MIILHDPDTLAHETEELLGSRLIPALESPERIREIVSKLSDSKHTLRYVKSPGADSPDLKTLLQLLLTAHGNDYLEHLKSAFQQWREAGLIEEDGSILPECFLVPNKSGTRTQPPKDIFAQAGYFAFDMSSGIMKNTYTSILASANLAVQAVDVLHPGGTIKDVLALCRPPGHHCDGRHAGGYCYVNNVAVAVSAWRKHSPDVRVGILDIDFHHGNGTQDIFYSDPNVFYTSIHGEDEFPYYTGSTDETGEGKAIGANLNLPLKTGSSFEMYLEKLEVALSALVKFQAEFLVLSLGFDTFRLDPLGSFQIATADYEVLARWVRKTIASIPAVILLEGGYSIEHLGDNVLSFLKGWESAATLRLK